MAFVYNKAHDAGNLRKMDTSPTSFSKRRVTSHKTLSENKHVTKEKGKRKKNMGKFGGLQVQKGFGRTNPYTHFLLDT
jgi:hypothetical protein